MIALAVKMVVQYSTKYSRQEQTYGKASSTSETSTEQTRVRCGRYSVHNRAYVTTYLFR